MKLNGSPKKILISTALHFSWLYILSAILWACYGQPIDRIHIIAGFILFTTSTMGILFITVIRLLQRR